MRVSRTGPILPLKINTMPHPGFPTDMQPLMGVLLSVADGTSTVTEGVWDNRFRYVDELRKMGANVQVDGQVAVFEGVDYLSPAPLRASDLRAGAAMVVAALIANGTSEIEDIGHIQRGYENIVQKLQGLGADIRKIEHLPASLEQARNRQKRTQSVLGRAVSFPVHRGYGGAPSFYGRIHFLVLRLVRQQQCGALRRAVSDRGYGQRRAQHYRCPESAGSAGKRL